MSPKVKPSSRTRTKSEARLTGIGVKNFRAFEDEVYLQVSPITLLFGANSAGKTSILNALKLLRQSAFRRNITVRGRDVDLGRAYDLANRNSPDSPIKIRVDLSNVHASVPTGHLMLADWMRSSNGDRTCGLGIEIIHAQDELRVSAIELFIGSSKVPILRWAVESNPTDEQRGSQRPFEEMSADFVNKDHPIWKWFVSEFGAETIVGMALMLCRDPYDLEEEVRLDLPGIEVVMPDLNGLFSALVQESREHYLGALLPPATEGGIPIPAWIPEETKLFQAGPETDFVRNLLDKAKLALKGNAGAQYASLLADANRFTQLEVRSWVPVNASVSNPLVRQHPLWEAWSKNAPSINVAFEVCGIASLVRELLDRMQVISADRKVSQRYYVQGDSFSENSVGSSSVSLSRLLSHEDPQRVLDKVNARLTQSEIGIQYDVVKWDPPVHAGSMPSVLAFTVRDKDGRSRSITDVGRGTQDLLPIALTLLESASFKGSSLVLIEEPESHLHPALQQAVGSFLASIASEAHSTLIVETHSEAMLKRIMSHLGSDRMPHLSADKVSLSYVSRSADSSSIEQIRVDNNGRVVDEWPFAARRDGFTPLE